MKPLIPHTKWERSRKEDFQSRHVPLQQSVDQGNDKGYDFDNFTQDLFSSLYQSNPEFPEQTTPGASWAKKALDELASLPDYKQARQQGTVLDHFQSGLGSSILARHFVESLPEMEQPNPDDLTQRIESLQDLMSDFADDTQKIARIEKRIEDAAQQLPEASKAWQDLADNMDAGEVRQVWRKAIRAYQEEMQQIEDAANGFGFGTGPGEDGYTDPALKLAMAEQVRANPNLQRIAKLAGRFKREARRTQSNKKQPGPDEITSIETGRQLDRVLPSESMRMMDDVLEMDFMRRYVERSLVQYQMESPKDAKKEGPIVVCVDDSSSMKGNRDIWAKAIAIALCQIAADKNRPYAMVHFASKETEPVVYEFTDTQNIDPNEMVKAVSEFLGGGTDFGRPLWTAYKLIAEHKHLNKADIIFITDGDCKIDSTMRQDLAERKDKLNINIYTIVLEARSLYGHIDELSDSVTTIPDLLADDADEQAKDIVFNI
jgi:uncharacterized protein with von Willebrand factor type A (vWA) domain